MHPAKPAPLRRRRFRALWIFTFSGMISLMALAIVGRSACGVTTRNQLGTVSVLRGIISCNAGLLVALRTTAGAKRWALEIAILVSSLPPRTFVQPLMRRHLHHRNECRTDARRARRSFSVRQRKNVVDPAFLLIKHMPGAKDPRYSPQLSRRAVECCDIHRTSRIASSRPDAINVPHTSHQAGIRLT